MTFNKSVNLLNELFKFKREKQMDDYCILDVIDEYAFRNDCDPEELCYSLSEYEGFKEIVEQDLIKFKYSKNKIENSGLEAWNV